MYPEVALNAPQSRMQQRIIDDFGGGEKVLPWLKSMGVDSIELRMQIYADVLNMPIHVTATKQGPALGSAIMGAVAAGVYENIAGAADKMHAPEKCVYMPDPERAKLYDAMYADYCELQAYFGQGGSDVMKRLLARRQQQK